MASGSTARLERTRAAGVKLLTLGRLAFWASYILAFSTPSWNHGVFTLFPIATLTLSTKTYSVGIFALLPALALLGVVWKHPGNERRAPPARWEWPSLPVASWALLVLLRAWPARVWRISLISTAAVTILALAYLCTRRYGKDREITVVFAVLLLFQGTVACAQFLLQRSLGLSALGELALRPEGSLASVIEVGGRRYLRAYGLTGHPNVLGGYLTLWLLVCLGQATRMRAAQDRRARVPLWVAMAAGAAGIFCSFSRAAWLGLFVGLLYMALLERGRVAAAARRLGKPRPGDWRRTAAAVIICGILITVLLANRELLLSRFFRLGQPLESRSIRERVEDLAQAWGLVRRQPWLGVGAGYYLQALWDQAGPHPPPGFRLVHNIPLLAWAELGILGPILWLWMLLIPPMMAWKNARKRTVDADEAGWAAAFLAATVLSLFDSYLYLPVTLWPAWGLGVLAGGWAKREAQREHGGSG